MGNTMPDGISRGSCMKFKCGNRDRHCDDCLNEDMYVEPVAKEKTSTDRGI